MTTPNREELLDRLMHQTLEEKLGTARPCDVAEKIENAIPLATDSNTGSRRSRRWMGVSAVAASITIAVGVATLYNESRIPFFSAPVAMHHAKQERAAGKAAQKAAHPTNVTTSSEPDEDAPDSFDEAIPPVPEMDLTDPAADHRSPNIGLPDARELMGDDSTNGSSASIVPGKASEGYYADYSAKGSSQNRPPATDVPPSPSTEVRPSEGNEGKYADAQTQPTPQSETPAEPPSAKPADGKPSEGAPSLAEGDRGGRAGKGGGERASQPGNRVLPRWVEESGSANSANASPKSARPGSDSPGSNQSVASPSAATKPSPYAQDDVAYSARRDRDIVDRDGDGFADEIGPRVTHPDTGEGRDRFARLNDNRFLAATENPLSTFSIDVDTASYSVVRSRLDNRVLPPPAAVRVEELVNYFSYSYPQPTDGAPFAVHVDVAACPWAAKHRLVRIGLKGKEIAKSDRPASNLVFLVDVSGSMQPQNKLPLVKHGLLRLVGELDERDRVAIVVYAGSSGCVLASTPCTQANKERIRSAITSLESGGSTNGEAGIQLAYQIAQDHFVKSGANRVILCTDGDFNVGTTGDDALKQLVADRAKSGVFLTALGFGMGNHNDQMLEAIADNGNGTYGYIDDQREVEKLFVRDLSGTLITIAKDVKIQVEFNPAQVGAYRLIGYENRILAKEDFNNDKKDAGDIGAGHTVTALYEIVPPAALAEASKANAAASEGLNTDATSKAPGNVDALEFQRPKQEFELTEAAKTSGDLLLVKLRYKAPDGDTSTLIKTPAKDHGATFAAASSDFKFAASVAAFGMILRQSPFRGDITLAAVEEIAAANRGEDENNQRREFLNLVQQLRAMTQEESRAARD